MIYSKLGRYAFTQTPSTRNCLFFVKLLLLLRPRLCTMQSGKSKMEESPNANVPLFLCNVLESDMHADWHEWHLTITIANLYPVVSGHVEMRSK